LRCPFSSGLRTGPHPPGPPLSGTCVFTPAAVRLTLMHVFLPSLRHLKFLSFFSLSLNFSFWYQAYSPDKVSLVGIPHPPGFFFEIAALHFPPFIDPPQSLPPKTLRPSRFPLVVRPPQHPAPNPFYIPFLAVVPPGPRRGRPRFDIRFPCTNPQRSSPHFFSQNLKKYYSSLFPFFFP